MHLCERALAIGREVLGMSMRKRNAIAVIALAACLLIPIAHERPAFTGAYVTMATAGADDSHRGGWDFAPVPGVRFGVDAEASGDASAAALSVGSRVGAVVTPRTLVYVRAGYARAGRGHRGRRHGLELAAGIERIAGKGASTRREIQLAANDTGRTITSENSYRL